MPCGEVLLAFGLFDRVDDRLTDVDNGQHQEQNVGVIVDFGRTTSAGYEAAVRRE